MMHVRFNEAWHGKVQQTILQLSGAQYATSCILTKHHINYLVISRLSYPTILNVVKHGKRVKQMKTTYLVKVK